MKNNIGVAVVGLSGMGKLHIKGILAHPHAHLAAVCDINEERLQAFKEEFHAPVAVNDYKELLNIPEIDAVVLVVPDGLHLEMTEAFLRAGKDVLCEKPMALNLGDCEKMLRAEKETGRKLMIGQVCRCTPAFVMAKKMVEEGRIGELFFVESEYAHNYEKSRGTNDWRVVPERHGFIGGGCHAVDLLRWIAGNPSEVFAYANHKCLPDWPTDDCAVALYSFPNNVAGKVFVSTGCFRNYTMRSVFYGTKGTIICDNTSPTITLFEAGLPDTAEGRRSYTLPQELPVEINNHNITEEIAVFIDALLAGGDMPVSALEGASTVAVCCATVEAANKHMPVQIRYPE
ncbi:MAG: Gfo/Idh/MocA family oxidoreductase [Clostridia bacterium]|nr:Gfo/Idh/MocA family oxidoreductase [Clostridia bacterium]